MNQLGFDLFTSFHSLSANNKEKFNIALNRYINELGEEWEYIMNNDFQFICSEKIFVPAFQFVNVPKDEDMDQKSQSSSSDESLGSFAKKSAKKSIKKTDKQSVKLSNKKRTHCAIASAATNTQDTKMEAAA